MSRSGRDSVGGTARYSGTVEWVGGRGKTTAPPAREAAVCRVGTDSKVVSNFAV